MKAKRKTTRRTVGTHWCGGTLEKDGQRAVRCTKCDRVSFAPKSGPGLAKPDPTRHLWPGGVRPPRLPNGTRVHVRSDHFAEECDARITKATWDDSWLYRVKVTAGQTPKDAQHDDGTVWVWDFETTPL